MNPIRILHLEDNRNDSELAHSRLESDGMAAIFRRVEEQSEFVEALRSGGIDLILADYSLPNFNGLQALDLSRQIRPEVPFVFLSGKLDEGLAVEFLKQGALDYVRKDFLPRLPGAIARAMALARAQEEKTLADLELRESKARLAALIENSSDSIWSVDPDFRLMSFNSTASGMFHSYLGVELRLGTRMDELVPAEAFRTSMRDSLSRALKGERFRYELEPAPHSGREVHLEIAYNPIRSGSGIIGVVVFSRNISERKLAHKEILKQRDELERVNAILSENQAQLIQSEKLASIGQLAAGITHEINNPMTFVTSNLGTLLEYAETIKAALPAELRREKNLDGILDDIGPLVSESLAGAGRVNEIVASLRTIARVDDSRTQPLDVQACLEEALKLAWNEVKYKCVVRKEFSELPKVQGHPGQLNQVFLNLIVNAAQAFPDHGTITLRTLETDGEVVIEVQDDGPGIAAENLSRIFTPFFTTKPVGKGTGLGLSISFGIIQAHGGTMHVQSPPGQGTTFTISLPKTRAAA